MSSLDERGTDFQQLGNAVAELYLQAINGVVCDPTNDSVYDRTHCEACGRAWKTAVEILDRYDEHWGNMFRSGPTFQPSTNLVLK